MTTPDLTPTLRAALDVLLFMPDSYKVLTDQQRAELTALRDACPERWLPTGDGLAVYVDCEGFRSVLLRPRRQGGPPPVSGRDSLLPPGPLRAARHLGAVPGGGGLMSVVDRSATYQGQPAPATRLLLTVLIAVLVGTFLHHLIHDRSN